MSALELTLTRRAYMRDVTMGEIECGGTRLYTLELPWRDNHAELSCVPAGRYALEPVNSQEHGKVLLLLDVPGRSGIQIHRGDYVKDTRGCILVGLSFTGNEQYWAVWRSRAALAFLLGYVGAAEPLSIVIHDAGAGSVEGT